MLQNKIYQNFCKEILKTFFLILFGLSLIALTVRAVSFLDLIVDSGYPILVYFKYSFLNLFGIAPKFVPLSFLLALTIFCIKHIRDSEFVILWTSGVKKISLVNLFFFVSTIVLIFYLFLSAFLTPLALNKSRQLLGDENLNSVLPTIKKQEFSDTFKDLTVFVERKENNEIENIFLHDSGSNISNFSSNSEKTSSTTILSKKGLVEGKKIILFDGQIISNKKDSGSEIVKFDQLNIDLSNLNSTTIKQPKIQETSTLKLLQCLSDQDKIISFCSESFKKEILPTLNRRLVIPFYIPVLSLICSLLLIKTKKIYFNKVIIFLYSFSLLLFTEIAVRFTGVNSILMTAFIITPIVLLLFSYSILTYKFSKESKTV